MKVYVTAASTGGNSVRLHTDPDCPRLSNARNVIGPKDRDLYGEDVPFCSWCVGDNPSRSNHDPNFGPIRALEEAAGHV